MRRRLIATLLTAALVLSGCWSRREINDMAPVVTLGFDRVDQGFEVTAAIAQPAASAGHKGAPGAEGRPKVVLQRRGTTITEALQTMQKAASRRLTLHHSQVIVLGERLAKAGVDPLLDFLLRSPELRLHARVFMLRGAPVADLLTSQPLMENIQSEALREMDDKQTGLAITLKDVAMARAAPYTSVLLPVLELQPHPENVPGAPTNEVVLTGAALFSAQRLATYLDPGETGGTMWLLGSARQAVVTIPCPGAPDQALSAQVVHADRAISPQWDGRRLSFRVVLTGDLYMADVQCPVDLSDPATVARIEAAMRQNVAERVAGVLRKAQAVPADAFGFGERVRARWPALWHQVGDQRWLATWAKTPVQIEPRIKVTHMQTTTFPPFMQGVGAE
jgi:spore germination protein KC